MKIAVIGSGGREHALVWRLLQDGHDVVALPGSDAIPNSVAVDVADHDALAAELVAMSVDLTVIGPEAPLQRGLADFMRARNMPVVGPGQAAARLETSKAFAKEFMAKHAVATAHSITAIGFAAAKLALADFPNGVVVKFDGLAAGKGVEVCDSKAEALDALDTFSARYGPNATFVLEQRLRGREVSVLALVANAKALLLPPAQDHKRLLNDDLGPNTGGMGAICPLPWLTPDILKQIQDDVVAPTLTGLASEQLDYRGVLYFGIMVTTEGPKLLEYNVRFGDPETQAILPQIQGDLGELFRATALGDLTGQTVALRSGYSAAVVVAAPGYPENPIKGLTIIGLDESGSAEGAVQVFHAGTRRDAKGWLSNGGRILAVLGQGTTLRAALVQATKVAGNLGGAALQMRSDIGKRALPKRCAVLLSGRGSNLQALLREQSSGVLAGMVEFCLVVSNREDAAGLQWAQEAGIATQILPSKGLQRPEFDDKLSKMLVKAEIEYVILAGFMRILGPGVVQAFPRRIFNIHPADTRLHQGLHGYQWALAQKLKSTKITVHLLDEGLDTGPILAQAEVDLTGATTFEEVQMRGLRAEHTLYSRAIRDFLLENG